MSVHEKSPSVQDPGGSVQKEPGTVQAFEPPVHLVRVYQEPIMTGAQHPKVFRCGREFQSFDRWTRRSPDSMSQAESLCICDPCYEDALQNP